VDPRGARLSALAALAAAHLDENEKESTETASPFPDLLLLRHFRPTPLSPTLYEPVVCLILQGQKETGLGDTLMSLGPGDALVVSHDVPVVSQITEARPGQPYLAMILALDLGLLRDLHEEVGEMDRGAEDARAMAVHEAGTQLLDALTRYLALAGNPLESKVMAPLLRREIHFRLLIAPHGSMLRRLLRLDSHESNIARAIAHIRRDFRSSIAIPELAREIGMSPSAFHKHFKAVTETTPLRYQKELRLLEAKRLLASGAKTVSTVAFDVGYESPTQFSREYSRKFGVPPRRDLAERS
jgi:AraC-like DNA-binding protein